MDTLDGVKEKYIRGDRVFTSHEVAILIARISWLEKQAAQQSVQLTALQRGTNLLFAVNIFQAVLLVLALFGGN